MPSTPLPIVGTKFHGAHAEMILGTIAVGTRLWLIPEPGNRFDPNAKAVVLRKADLGAPTIDAMSESLLRTADSDGEWHLGYIPAAVAAHPKLQAVTSELPCLFEISPTGKPMIRLPQKEDQA